MESLDLTKAPPRGPRVPLAGLDLIMAARSVDKMRATLPGGNLGTYQIKGFTTRMFETLTLSEDEFRDIVARAENDADVATWFRERCTNEQIAAFNHSIVQRTVGDRIDDAEFLKRYPHAVSLPLNTPLIDMLKDDDDYSFAER
jgi:hypothetical protein